MANILARIPQDNGRKIHWGAPTPMVVGPEPCEGNDCGKPATVIIQGETDSFGFEPVAFCDECLARCDGESRLYLDAEDVEDRAPKAGHLFLVSETKNADDGSDGWLRSFTSFRAAAAFYRRIEEGAARYAGLYPGQGVLEVPEAEAKARIARAAAARREEERLLRQEADDDIDAQENYEADMEGKEDGGEEEAEDADREFDELQRQREAENYW